MVFFFYLGLILIVNGIREVFQHKIIYLYCGILTIVILFDGFFTQLLKKYILDFLISL